MVGRRRRAGRQPAVAQQLFLSAARYCPDDQKGLRSRHDRIRQGRVRRRIRPVLLAGEEPQHRPAPLRARVSNRPEERWMVALQYVQDRLLSNRSRDLQLDHPAHTGQDLKILRQDDVDHASVCTSTESTAGRSRTTAAQLSPASADAYTWPPLVPKYTPHGSSWSTAMASRKTLT